MKRRFILAIGNTHGGTKQSVRPNKCLDEALLRLFSLLTKRSSVRKCSAFSPLIYKKACQERKCFLQQKLTRFCMLPSDTGFARLKLAGPFRRPQRSCSLFITARFQELTQAARFHSSIGALELRSSVISDINEGGSTILLDLVRSMSVGSHPSLTRKQARIVRLARTIEPALTMRGRL